MEEIKKAVDRMDKGCLRNALENVYLTYLFLKKEYISVIEDGRKFLQSADTDNFYLPLIIYKIAESCYYTKRFEEALRYYQEIEKHYHISPVYPYAVLGKGWVFINTGRYREGRDLLLRSISSHVISSAFLVSAIYGIGISYLNSSMYDSAFVFFSTYNEDFYKRSNFYTPLASELNCRINYFAAISAANLWNNLDPSTTIYLEKALEYFKKVIYDYPSCEKTPFACYITGWLYFKKGDYEDAIEFLEKSKKYAADSASIYDIDILIAQSYYNANKIPEAMSIYRFLKDKLGEKEDVIAGLEQCYVKLITLFLKNQNLPLDSIEEILLNFEKEVPKSDEFSFLALKLAESYFIKDNHEKTVEWSCKVLKFSTDENVLKKAKSLKIKAQYELKKWEDVAKEGDSYIKQYGFDDDPDLTLVVGIAYSHMGDEKGTPDYYQKAINILEEFVKKYPTHPWIDIAKKILNHCKAKAH